MVRWSVASLRSGPQGLFLKTTNVIIITPFLLWKKKRTSVISNLAFTTNSSDFGSPLLSSLSGPQREQVTLYVDTLLEWNQRMNLTAVTERSDIMKRHVEDSLAIIPVIHNDYAKHCSANSNGIRVVDVGSGPGLPGIVLAIACPDWEITLLESLRKRCHFLEHAVKHSHLSNVRVVCGRAENIGQNVDFREMFDVAVARAVAELRILAEYCLPLVRVGGLFIAAKGYNPQEEVENAKKAIRIMGSSILPLHSVQSEGPFGQRTAVSCLKHRPTPGKYPRLPGVAAKLPL